MTPVFMEALLNKFVAAGDEEEVWDDIEALNDEKFGELSEKVSKLKEKVLSEDEDLDDSDEEGDIQEGEEDFDQDDIDFDDIDEDDFDNLDPREQLKLLMKPVEDDPGLYDDEEGEQEDEDDEEDSEEDALPKKSVKFDLLDEVESGSEKDDDEQNNRPKSSFELQQARLKRTIAQLEAENVAGKDWAMSGEISASRRPADSLLQEDLEFEHVTKLAPTITEEVTDDLEALIKRRIKDAAWDDVERIPEDLQKETMKKKAASTIELNDEKSKVSLAEQYEADYQAKRTKLTSKAGQSLNDDPGLDDATKAAHEECRQLFGKLCKALDQLSENKFAPRSYELAEVEIKTLTKPTN